MSPAREIELKLEVPAHSFYRLARSSLLRAARKKSSKPATLVSVYFDTDKLTNGSTRSAAGSPTSTSRRTPRSDPCLARRCGAA